MSIPNTCLHTMMDGHRCGCMALTGKPYCHFHTRHYVHNARPSDPDYELPIFEDSRSILLAIRETMDAYMRGKLDQKHTTTLLYSYQIAMSGVHRPDGMSPDALRQLELRQAAQAQAKRRTSSRAPAEEVKEEDSSLVDYLAESLQQMTGEPIDLECKHLPPGERPSRAKAFLDALQSQCEPLEPPDPNRP